MRVGSPQGRFADSAALLDGEVLEGAEAWGKQLFIEFPVDRFVHVHLGLIGAFDVHTGYDVVPPPVGQVRLRLIGERPDGYAYADLRGATRLRAVDPRAARRRGRPLGAGPHPSRRRPDAGLGADPAEQGADRWAC